MACCDGCDEIAGLCGGGSAFAVRDVGIGKLLPTFVTPAAVRAQKERLTPLFASTDRAVLACAALAPEERAAWSAFNSSWLAYVAAEDSFWGVTSEYDAGVLFEKTLQGWQNAIAGRCALPGPIVVTHDDADASSLSAVKWAAAAVVAVAVVYGLSTVVGSVRAVSSASKVVRRAVLV